MAETTAGQNQEDMDEFIRKSEHLRDVSPDDMATLAIAQEETADPDSHGGRGDARTVFPWLRYIFYILAFFVILMLIIVMKGDKA